MTFYLQRFLQRCRDVDLELKVYLRPEATNGHRNRQRPLLREMVTFDRRLYGICGDSGPIRDFKFISNQFDHGLNTA